MSTKTKKTTDLPAFAAALRKVMTRPFVCSSGQRLKSNSWRGKPAELMTELELYCEDWIHQTADRPHDAGELRRELKKHARELHSDHAIVVTLYPTYIDIRGRGYKAVQKPVLHKEDGE